MISKFSQIEIFFREINSVLNRPLRVYTIGGAVLLEQGLKPATKDIDLVVDTREEFSDFRRALETLTFTTKALSKEYTHMNLSQIFEKKEIRIDLFEKEVCGGFALTEGMKQRAKKSLN